MTKQYYWFSEDAKRRRAADMVGDGPQVLVRHTDMAFGTVGHVPYKGTGASLAVNLAEGTLLEFTDRSPHEDFKPAGAEPLGAFPDKDIVVLQEAGGQRHAYAVAGQEPAVFGSAVIDKVDAPKLKAIIEAHKDRFKDEYPDLGTSEVRGAWKPAAVTRSHGPLRNQCG
jgi:hypothetical protein